MKVFIAGPRSISKLDGNIESRLRNILIKDITIVVGDANGVDRAVQEYYAGLGYSNVHIYASGSKVRNNAGNWPVEHVSAGYGAKGFDFYTAKDIKMAEAADYGFMIWDGKSKGTLNNILNLVSMGKIILLYMFGEAYFFNINNLHDFEFILHRCTSNTKELFEGLVQKKHTQIPLLNIDINSENHKSILL